MSSRGKAETEVLIKNMEDQMNRLVQQLADLDEYKNDMEAEEYEENRKETLDQLKEFGESLGRMKEGDLTLVDHLNSIQLTLQAAISEAFKTPKVMRMFVNKQNSQLRILLSQIERDLKIGKLSKNIGESSKAETLLALKKLGEKLSHEEEEFLKSKISTSEFASVSANSSDGKLLADLGAQVKAASAK